MIICVFIASTQKESYRIKSVKRINDKSVKEFEFILPPNARLAYEGIFHFGNTLEYKEGTRYRYQYVLFKGLKLDTTLQIGYPEVVEAIQKPEYFYKKQRQQAIHSENFNGLTGPGEKTVDGSAVIYLSADRNNLAIEIDFHPLMKGAVVANFQEMAKGLLKRLSSYEGAHWPASISQDIVEQVFETIPIPQEASLARYAYLVTPQESFVLLNPKIAWKVEHQGIYSPTTPTASPKNWSYGPASQEVVTFFRGRDGRIKQAPFLMIENGKNDLPNNSPIGMEDDKHNLQTTSADLQLSQNTNKQMYMGLYQNFFKRSIHTSSYGSDNADIREDNNLFSGNSMLLLNTNMSALLDDFNASSNVKAIYGSGGPLYFKFSRNLITPIIYIHLNESIIPVKLGATLGVLNQNMDLGKDLIYLRQYNGEYKQVKNWNSDLLLLPGDKIRI